MFKRLFKKNTESTENTEEVIIPCACEGEREHCDLILQLRKYQDLRKDIKNEIEILEKDSWELICHFIVFLKKLEKNGLRMDKWGQWDWLSPDRSESIIKRTIEDYSSDDIFRITEELRTYKNKKDIICEKQRALKAVEDDIKNIKTKLGID